MNSSYQNHKLSPIIHKQLKMQQIVTKSLVRQTTDSLLNNLETHYHRHLQQTPNPVLATEQSLDYQNSSMILDQDSTRMRLIVSKLPSLI